MKKSSLIGRCVLIAASTLLLQSAPVFAEEGAPPPPAGIAGSSRNFDWVQHTQRTLEELKGKLHLAPEQMPAWDTWSRGVMKDAHQQLEQRQSGFEEKGGRAKPAADPTTPERMARGIERLRAETKWMQEHLVQLEAAQVRTEAFYNTLSTDQKTIFDLFWHEFYHRVSGPDGGWSMREHKGSAGGH
ncbi:MAG: Spy/CpxP family protein refolding chaperone [Rhodoferax sp.]|nr:Spy/CpxP family protein refolding chaperone [Rhodoferax sp.]